MLDNSGSMDDGGARGQDAKWEEAVTALTGFALLDAIAIAGGSDCTPDVPGSEACDVSTAGTESFLAALDAIREGVVMTETITEVVTTNVTTTIPCEWSIPPRSRSRSSAPSD
jgi:hypothetical protein